MALERIMQTTPSGHPQIAETRLALAAIALRRGDAQQALMLADEGLADMHDNPCDPCLVARLEAMRLVASRRLDGNVAPSGDAPHARAMTPGFDDADRRAALDAIAACAGAGAPVVVEAAGWLEPAPVAAGGS